MAWRPSGTTDWLLIYTMDGMGRFGYADGELLTRKHDVVLLRPGTLHDYGVPSQSDRWELLWTHFHPRQYWHDWLHWPEHAPGLCLLRLTEPIVRAKIIARLSEAHLYATGRQRRHDAFAMNALEEALLWCDTQNPRARIARSDPRVDAMLDFLHRHLSEKLNVPDMAASVELSTSRAAHLFREKVGSTPQHYLERLRIDRAKQLLELTSLPIEAIAEQIGFENPFYFSGRFKRAVGTSPRDYRKQSSREI